MSPKDCNRTIRWYIFSALTLALVALGTAASSTSAALPAKEGQTSQEAQYALPPPLNQLPAHALRAMPDKVLRPFLREPASQSQSLSPRPSIDAPNAGAPQGEACWVVDPSQNPGTGNNYLLGVSMVSATDGWAVGYYTSTTVQADSLIQRYNGTQWNLYPHPDFGSAPNTLESVTVVTGTNGVWAAGYISTTSPSPRLETLVLRKESGPDFLRQTSPNVGMRDNVLLDIDYCYHCDEVHPVAVGYFLTTSTIEPLILVWDGTSQFTRVISPILSGFTFLTGVVAISPTEFWAVGYYLGPGFVAQTFVLRCVSLSCDVIPSDNVGTGANVLNDIDSDEGPITIREAFGAGYYYLPGSDTYLTLLERHDGTRMTVVPSPNMPGDNYLNDIVTGYDSWRSQNYLFAVGSHDNGAGNRPMALTDLGTGSLYITKPYSYSVQSKFDAVGALPYNPIVIEAVGHTEEVMRLDPGQDPEGFRFVTLAMELRDPCSPPPTPTPGGPPTPTNTPTIAPPPPTPTPCMPHAYSDVPTNHTFYQFITCLSQRGVVSGYGDCTFRPGNDVTRGQIAKMVSSAAAFNDDVTGRHTYTDVPSTHTFWLWIERLSLRGVMGGYACGGQNEPCDPQSRPYFRPGNNATRGQVSKIVANAAGYSDTPPGQTFTDVPPSDPFWLWIERLATRSIMGGYPCGGQGEACDPQNRPYFRPGNNVTRGQSSKIVANTFFPNCQTP